MLNKAIKIPQNKQAKEIEKQKGFQFQGRKNFWILWSRRFLFLLPFVAVLGFIFLTIFFNLQTYDLQEIFLVSSTERAAWSPAHMALILIVLIFLFFCFLLFFYQFILGFLIFLFSFLYLTFSFFLLTKLGVKYDFLTLMILFFYLFLGIYHMFNFFSRFRHYAKSRLNMKQYLYAEKFTELKTFSFFLLPFLFLIPIYSWVNIHWSDNFGTILFYLWGSSFLVYWVGFYLAIVCWFFSSDMVSKYVFQLPQKKKTTFVMKKLNYAFLYRFFYRNGKLYAPALLIFFLLLFFILLLIWILQPDIFSKYQFKSIWIKRNFQSYSVMYFKYITALDEKYMLMPGTSIGASSSDTVIAFFDNLTPSDMAYLNTEKWILREDIASSRLIVYILKQIIFLISLGYLLPTFYFGLRYGWKILIIFLLSFVLKLILILPVLWLTNLGFNVLSLIFLFFFAFTDLTRFQSMVKYWQKLNKLNAAGFDNYQTKLVAIKVESSEIQLTLKVLQIGALVIVAFLSAFPLRLCVMYGMTFFILWELLSYLETMCYIFFTRVTEKHSRFFAKLYEKLVFKNGREEEVKGIND